jgi:hypothetical protein
MSNNLYEILQVSPFATTQDIARSYRKLAKCYHPDHGGNPDDFIKIDRAYRLLQDSSLRQRYDESLTRNILGIPIQTHQLLKLGLNALLHRKLPSLNSLLSIGFPRTICPDWSTLNQTIYRTMDTNLNQLHINISELDPFHLHLPFTIQSIAPVKPALTTELTLLSENRLHSYIHSIQIKLN